MLQNTIRVCLDKNSHQVLSTVEFPLCGYAHVLQCNKNSNVHGRSPNVVKVILRTIRNCS